MTKVKVMIWMLLVAQLNVNVGASTGTTTTLNLTISDVNVTPPNGMTQGTVQVTATDISSSNNNVSETTSTDSTELGNTTITTTTTETMSTTKAIEETSTQSLQQSTTTIKNACSTSSFGPSKMNFASLIAMSAAGGVIVLSVIWSICICCWYRRKFNRLLSEKKSENDAEKSVLLHEMNGRKASAVTYRGDNVDKDFSSGVLSTHSKVDESDERMSDLYDVTDPDYEDADKEMKVKVSEKSRKVNDDDEVEDGEYDILNIEDKKEKRESDYACAEFKKSKDDVDCDTYDTTETCKRIVCNGNHKHGNGETDERQQNIKTLIRRNQMDK
ncbi:uncharacterized protein LOC134253582 isoform X2 [Saccostrea cucullata]|uniref:uncharacterized protein LOC134253582 isoform X2 n=1 Tax=Saccostrea cuccullata TaxID=36930 RepID=UPI002ED54DCA